MNESVGDKRVSYYDWLRIIATFYVVFGHSLYLEYKTMVLVNNCVGDIS